MRALDLGLPSVAFTEHADLTPWTLRPDEEVPDAWRPLIAEGVLTPPPPDLDGYRRASDRAGNVILVCASCRASSWANLTGTRPLGAGGFERVLASVHSTPTHRMRSAEPWAARRVQDRSGPHVDDVAGELAIGRCTGLPRPDPRPANAVV